MNDLTKLIKSASGISSQLDCTLISLANSLSEKESEDKDKIIEDLQNQINELNETIDSLKIELLNQNINEDQLAKTKESIIKAFNKSNNILFWYIDNYNKSFFEIIEKPIIRVTICKELIKQGSSFYPNTELPKLWYSIIENNGLLK